MSQSEEEEEEFRKMAEIADAINDILENNKLDDGSDASPEDISVSEDTENQDTNTHVLSEEVTLIIWMRVWKPPSPPKSLRI